MDTNDYINDPRNQPDAVDFNGNLYVHIAMYHFGKTYSVHKEFYTVMDGIVYQIHKDILLYPSGDSLLRLSIDCIKVGKYNPDKAYKRTIRNYTYSEFKKLLKL